jgi:hypothetical protein
MLILERGKMIKSLLLLVALLASTTILPSFDEFPATEIFKGKPAKVNLKSHKEARTYRTALREGVLEGPNFAGRYTVVGIGCGSGCEIIAVVDASNGKVFFPKGLTQVFTAGWWHEPFGPEFKLNSRLLIVHGEANNEEAPYGDSYYEWTGIDFKLLRFEPRDKGKAPEIDK